MSRIKERELAIQLRKDGNSYSQIKKALGISKSTLSDWLKNYPLSKERIKELRGKNERQIERFRETMRGKREKRLKEVYLQQKEKLLPLNDRELLLAGILLYWGEGSKYKMTFLGVSNTDPAIINFFIRWLDKSFEVPREKIKIQLQLYNDMDINTEIQYWSNILKIPTEQFNKPYIKKTSSQRINHKGSFGHGTCLARVNSVPLAEKMHMSIKVISEFVN